MARGLGTALGVAIVTLCLHSAANGGTRLALRVLALAGAAAGVTSLAPARHGHPVSHAGEIL